MCCAITLTHFNLENSYTNKSTSMCTNPHTQITQEFTDFGKLPTSMDSDEEKVSALTGEKNILTIYLIFNSYNGRGDFLFLVNGEI